MSICNRCYHIQDIIYRKFPEIYSFPKWSLIYFFPHIAAIQSESDIERHFFKLTIESYQQKGILNQIYVYTYKHDTNHSWYQPLVDVYHINLIEIHPSDNDKTIKLMLINQFISTNPNTNFIFMSYPMGFISSKSDTKVHDNTVELNNVHRILSKFHLIDDISHMTNSALNKFLKERYNITKIIDSDLLIVPYTIENSQLLSTALFISQKINTTDESVAANIALTIANYQFNNIIEDINNISILKGNYFTSYLNIICRNNTRESYLRNMNSFDDEKGISVGNTYHEHPDYLFYPYLDIDAPRIYQDQLSNIFNTRGFQLKIDNKDNKSGAILFYKRFNTKTNGVFVRKNNGDTIIPKILHLIHLDNNELDTKYMEAWGKFIREPWEYRIWTYDSWINRYEHPLNKRWILLNERINDPILKQIIIYISILERYGGITVNSQYIPIKSIPDEMLMQKFLIGFFNESLGTSLSYDIMASVPGYIDSPIEKQIMHNNVGRIPFEGVNNFFRKNRQKNKEIEMKRNDESNDRFRVKMPLNVTFPIIFEKMYQILSSIDPDDVKLNIINDFLLKDHDVIIYPSYYFNPNPYIFPKRLLNLAICFHTNNPQYQKKMFILENCRKKTELKRNYVVTPNGIIANLASDPKQRLLSLK